MQHFSHGASLPDALVRAIRAASKPFFQIQSSRYALDANSKSDLGFVSLVMKTKAIMPQEKFDSSHLLPSAWSELYRTAMNELADTDAKELWGLVSTVLRVVEQGAADCVNASAAIVEWHSCFDDELEDVGELIRQLHCWDPRTASDVLEEFGSKVLGRIEGAFLTGHFHAAASLMDALLLHLRRGGSALLTAEVETVLANVKRLLTVAFHDPVSHQQWVEAANDELQDSRIILLGASQGSHNPNAEDSGSSAGGATVVDRLVEDLCAASLDILLLITKDAKRMCARCIDSHRTATDFLVAVCAIMEPYADLRRVYSLFAKYVEDWDNIDDRQWYYECVLVILGVDSVADMVAAMHEVATIVAETSPQAAALSSTISSEEAYSCDDDDDADAASDTVSLDALTAATKPPSRETTRRFIFACMTAHVADLCAPAVVATSAAEIHLTFCRNELVTAYARLFATQPRTWRIAGLYACYSPLNDPFFLSEIVLAIAPVAAVDETVYRSLRAFFHTMWSTSSDHQQAVRAKLEAALPEHATVAKWWSAMEYYYSESYRDVHRHIIMTQLNSGNCVRAVWLAVQTQLTEIIESELRRQLTSKDALENAQLYTVGSAIQNGFIVVDACTSMELGRCLCAAAALSAYRKAATAANASFAILAQGQQSPLQPSRLSFHKCEVALEAAATCLQKIETALKSVVECHAMVHPSTIFTLVEHGASLLLSLRQLMRHPKTGESTGSSHISSCVLPLLIESYELANIHNVHHDPHLADRSRALAEQLAHVHQTSI